MSKYQILLYYQYTKVDDPDELKRIQEELCRKLNLKGRIIVASEGINGTLEGLTEDTEEYIKIMRHVSRFKDMQFKKSEGTGNAFPKLSIKVRSDIVSQKLEEFKLDPTKETGKYLKPEELHEWIHSGREFYLVDMRNDYETEVGYFKGAIFAPFSNFRDLPKVLPILQELTGKTIVTVCTGGVRCEKASAFLIKNGFLDVYQLYGGIVSYMEKYPNEDFVGKLYVFDGRVTMGFNTDSPMHKVVGRCVVCREAADTYYDCKNLYCQGKRHFISCERCISESRGYCQKCKTGIEKGQVVLNGNSAIYLPKAS